MLVFIQNMPESFSSEELHQLVEGAMSRSLFRFRRRGSIEKLDIIRIQDQDARTVEHHGLVDIEPDETALAALKRLNRSVMWGERVNARPYAVRSVQRDRRGHKCHKEDLSVINRRKGDRRRPNLIMEKLGDERLASRNGPDGD